MYEHICTHLDLIKKFKKTHFQGDSIPVPGTPTRMYPYISLCMVANILVLHGKCKYI